MERKYYILFSLLLIAVFSAKDILLLGSKTWPHLYPVINTSPLTFEEVYCYLPFLNRFSWATPLPAAPMVNPGLSQFTFFPALSLITQGIILKWLCFSNPDVYLFISHFLFPLISFWLLFVIYRKFIAAPWALLFAFWGVTFYYNFSLFAYFLNILHRPADIIQAASLRPLEITRTLTPNFTFLFFVCCFYLSIATYKIAPQRYILLTILWSLNLYVYLYNFIAGILFWFSYLIFTCYINEKPAKINVKPTVKLVMTNFIVMCLVISPMVYKFITMNSGVDQEILGNLGLIHKNSGIIVNEWGILFAYLLPLLLTITIVWLYCGDYYELIYRFTPIFILILVEIVVLNLHLVFQHFIHTYLFSIRIGNFFSRFLYYIPVVYFFSNPLKKLFHDKRKHLAEDVHNFIKKYIVGHQNIIAALGIMGMLVLITSSSIKYYRNHENFTALPMKRTEERLQELVALAKGKDTLVSEDLPVNILLPVLSQNASLVVSTFTNHVRGHEIIDRLVLFAKIYNWDQARLLDFMLPDKAYEDFYTENDFKVSEAVLKKGLGYWCVWHRRKMSEAELADYRKKLLQKYAQMNLAEAVKKYRVRIIQAYGEINASLPVKSVKSGREMKLYLLEI